MNTLLGIGLLVGICFGTYFISTNLPDSETILRRWAQSKMGAPVLRFLVGERAEHALAIQGLVALAKGIVCFMLSAISVLWIVGLYSDPKAAIGVLCLLLAGLFALLVIAAIGKWAWITLFQ